MNGFLKHRDDDDKFSPLDLWAIASTTPKSSLRNGLGRSPGSLGGAKKQIKANVVAPYAASRMSTLETKRTIGLSPENVTVMNGQSWEFMEIIGVIYGIYGILWWLIRSSPTTY